MFFANAIVEAPIRHPSEIAERDFDFVVNPVDRWFAASQTVEP